MKKIYCLSLVAVIFMCACQQKPATVPVDTEAAKTAIAALLDEFNTAFKGNDASKVMVLLTDDALTLGTDPSEFLSKKQISDAWTQAMADTTIKLDYSIDRREIRVAPDGKSAVVVEQFMFPVLSPKIPVRNIYHVIKPDDKWMIDFLSFSLIPKNEDLAKLNAALQ
jgi:uncharacterized protein (TIGR02246 family)